MKKCLFCWSGGKDSTLAFWKLKQKTDIELAALLTTFSQEFARSSMHGVRRGLLLRQVQPLALPVYQVELPTGCSDEQYAGKMRQILRSLFQQGVRSAAFGDIFLEDIRAYRENLLRQEGFRGIFPLWKRKPRSVAEEFIAAGFRAVVVAVDGKKLAPAYLAREFDRKFLADLPEGIDFCGENGEFHTFVYDGPLFSQPVKFEKGEIVERENGFYYLDLVEV